MLGLMQDWPLTVDKILDHAGEWHANRQVVTRSVECVVNAGVEEGLGGRGRLAEVGTAESTTEHFGDPALTARCDEGLPVGRSLPTSACCGARRWNRRR